MSSRRPRHNQLLCLGREHDSMQEALTQISKSLTKLGSMRSLLRSLICLQYVRLPPFSQIAQLHPHVSLPYKQTHGMKYSRLCFNSDGHATSCFKERDRKERKQKNSIQRVSETARLFPPTKGSPAGTKGYSEHCETWDGRTSQLARLAHLSSAGVHWSAVSACIYFKIDAIARIWLKFASLHTNTRATNWCYTNRGLCHPSFYTYLYLYFTCSLSARHFAFVGLQGFLDT